MKKTHAAGLLALVVLAGAVGTAQQAPPQPAASAPRPAATASQRFVAPGTPRPLPTAAPESVGISSERLARLHAGMQAYVDRKEVGGIVTLIARDGKVVDVHASGFRDVEAQTPMRPDTIFRIASMTKPITSVAVMMLQEEGKLLLTDPVSKFIPAFKGQRVIGEGGVTAPARREMTVRDLLSHRSGLSYGFLNAGPVGDAYRKEGVTDGLTSTTMTLERHQQLRRSRWRSRAGGTTAWRTCPSSRSSRVCRSRHFCASGCSLLGDGNRLSADANWPRMATVYSPDGAGGIRPMKDPESFGNTQMSPIASYKAPKRYFSGGAGLTSTARDYARFALMLANGGALDGVRLLSPKTLELMTASHTADLPAGGLTGPGAGFGLGFRVVTDVAATQTQGSEGVFGWSGIYGTVFWVDPKERLVAIMMVQRYPGSPVATGFQPLVYQALTR
jgi:CubicO group peptidase (beta-lactamase class C family)